MDTSVIPAANAVLHRAELVLTERPSPKTAALVRALRLRYDVTTDTPRAIPAQLDF